MPCDPQELRHVPLFELLDEEELAVLAGQVDLRPFAARQRIFKIGDPPKCAYILMSGSVRVSTVDDDQQEVVIDEPQHGGIFGLASMLDETPHQANAMALGDSTCVELDRDDLAHLLMKKPMAGLDMLTVTRPPDSMRRNVLFDSGRSQSQSGHRRGSDLRGTDR